MAKTKALISFKVTAYVFAYAKVGFSHDEAYMYMFAEGSISIQNIVVLLFSAHMIPGRDLTRHFKIEVPEGDSRKSCNTHIEILIIF